MISNFSLSFLLRLQERTTETRIYNCITFYFEFRYFFTQLTKEKKLVWQSSREAPLVCELTFVIFQTFSFPSIHLHHLRVHWRQAFRQKNEKMCLCDKTMMAARRHNKLLEGRLPIGRQPSCDPGNKDGRQIQLARDSLVGWGGTHG